jgi:hypothetical protein
LPLRTPFHNSAGSFSVAGIVLPISAGCFPGAGARTPLADFFAARTGTATAPEAAGSWLVVTAAAGSIDLDGCRLAITRNNGTSRTTATAIPMAMDFPEPRLSISGAGGSWKIGCFDACPDPLGPDTASGAAWTDAVAGTGAPHITHNPRLWGKRKSQERQVMNSSVGWGTDISRDLVRSHGAISILFRIADGCESIGPLIRP